MNHDEQLMIDRMRDLGWGRIENLVIRGGIPRITKSTKRLRSVRTDRNAEPTITRTPRRPHRQHLKLLAACRRMGDGVMSRIEVADGIPVSWEPAPTRSR